jgi:YbbR domain-containing protein
MPDRHIFSSRHGPTLRAILTDRLGLKLGSLLVAVLLWLVVRAQQPSEEYVDVAVIPELDSSLVLLGEAPRVRALVAGRAADLVKLYATPPVVRRTVSGDAPDTLVLDLAPGDVHVPAELSDGVHVLDIRPRSVTLRFESRATRRVGVVNDGRILVRGAGNATAAGTLHFDPEYVRVTGPRGAVRRLQYVRPEQLSLDVGDSLVHLADIDTVGLGVLVHPAQVKVRITRTPAARP